MEPRNTTEGHIATSTLQLGPPAPARPGGWGLLWWHSWETEEKVGVDGGSTRPFLGSLIRWPLINDIHNRIRKRNTFWLKCICLYQPTGYGVSEETLCSLSPPFRLVWSSWWCCCGCCCCWPLQHILALGNSYVNIIYFKLQTRELHRDNRWRARSFSFFRVVMRFSVLISSECWCRWP